MALTTRANEERPRDIRDDEGFALVIVLMAMLLLTALGLMLVLGTATETMVAAHFQMSQEAFYAADGGLHRVVDELGPNTDWTNALRGEQSAFSVGSRSAILSDGTSVDLVKSTDLMNCGHTGGCSPPEMDAVTADRPWGANNPRWNLYAHGPVNQLVPTASINSSLYVAVWVSDDACENDDDPTSDGTSPSNPGSGMVNVRAEAFGPRGTHKVVEATVARPPGQASVGIQVISWRELR
jgi:PilX N-terminal